jgi:hypothetical protein
MLPFANKGTENLMKLRKIGIGILLGIAAMRPHAFAASSFTIPMDFFVAGGGQSDIALGDLDGDGKPDVVLANYFGGGVTVFRNTSTSGVANASSFAPGVPLATGGVPLHVILADFDSDSRLDIVCVNQGSGTVSVLRNTANSGVVGTNSFAEKVDLNTASDPRWVAAGDYNGDGKLDLAVSCYGSGALSIFQNNSTVGTITFGARVDLGFNAAAGDMEAGDINGDGKPELLVPSANAAIIWVYPNVSTGGALSAASFGPRVSFPSANGASLALADMDGDGKLDIVTANASDNSVSVFRNTSTVGVIASNSLAPRVDFAAGYYPFRPAVGDINGDGRLDVAVPNSGHDTISVFLSVSSPGVFTADSFAPKTDHVTGNDPRTLAIADLDGDGLADMANAILLQSSFSVLRQQTNAPPVTTNAPGTLVSLWKAEGDAQDSAGSNHGTLMGGTGFAAGAVGQGFLLDGVNDYIQVPDSVSLHVANELTIEMWFKRADGTSEGGLIDKRNLSTCNFGLILSTVWGTELYYDDGSGFKISLSALPSAGVFHHIAGTFRQADATHVELKTYLDGQLARTDTLPGNLANTFNGSPLAIGSTRDGTEGFFRGVIDEVGIYNYALNASQVYSNYISITPPPPIVVTNPAPALVSLWHADGNAQDSVGSNHGTLMGGAGFAPGVAGQGFALDGINDYIRVPDSASLHLSQELSLEMWFKRADDSSMGALIDKRNLSTCNYGVIMSDVWGLQLYYNTGSGFQISFSPLPSAGVFHHLVGTFRQVNSTHVELKTYVNGQLTQSSTLPGNLANTFNGTAMAIGTDRDGIEAFFRGVIDEVAIYNYALSAAQVVSNFSSVIPPEPEPPAPPAPPAIVSLWHGDGDAQDAVGINHGTLMGGAGFGPGVSGQGFLLDGVNDYVRVPDSASLHLSNELTLELWFKREDSGSYGALIDKRNWSKCNFGVIMSDAWGLQLYYNTGSGFQISFSAVPAPGVFHHLVGSLRQVNAGQVELKTYIDGQLARTDTLPGNLANTFNGDALSIGVDRDGAGGSFFRGIIDEVTLYNYALNASQVYSNYINITPPVVPPTTNTTTTNSTGSLIALWHGDGNAQDAVGSNHGTLMGGAVFASGVAGQGFLLDGVNDYIRVPDSATLHLAGEFTVEMWFKREDSSSYGALIDKRNWNNCNLGVLMSPDWGLQLYYNDPSVSVGNTFEISFSSIPSAGVFHHLAGTFRQVDATHVEVKTYIDGQLVRSDTLPGNLNNTFNGDALAIGCDRDGAGGSYFRGIIDEVALYNYALSPTQISSNFHGSAISAPQIIAQPASQTVVEGESATFLVGAIGTAPLRYQWRFAGAWLVGETNSSLTLASVQPVNAGDYSVIVENNSGSVTSTAATLTVSQSGLAPSFVSEPLIYYSGAAGTTITLSANASGTPVLLYQWTFNGVAIPGATGSSLVLSNLQIENAGTYRLIVSNDFGSVVSSGSSLNVSVPGGGTLNFQNNSSTSLVYYSNGTEAVPAGAGFVAALYVGTNSDSLAPVGGTAVFVVPGRFLGGTRSVPFIAPGQQAQIQVRVWNSTVGATYEEAVALGGQHGASSVFSVTLGGGITPPPSLNIMPSFSLTAGTGVVGRRKILSANPASVMLSSFNRSAGTNSFILTGTPGATLAIEVSTDLVNWTVADYVINSSGAQTYLDQTAGSSGQRFYRARVIAP